MIRYQLVKAETWEGLIHAVNNEAVDGWEVRRFVDSEMCYDEQEGCRKRFRLAIMYRKEENANKK